MTVSSTVTSTTGSWDTTSNYTLVATFDYQNATDIECWIQDKSTTPYTLTQLTKDTATYPTVNAAKFNFDTTTSTAIIGTDHRNDANKRIYIRRSLALTQGVDYVETSAFPAEDHEDLMDKFALILQDFDLDLGKKIGMSNGSVFSGTPTFPEAVALSFVRWNSGATDLEAVTSANAGFTASDVANVPSGNLAATNVQTALNELQTNIDADNATAAAHIANMSNPHTVTAAQVGNGTAQWNADKIQGVTVDDASKGNNKALVYKSASGNLEYTSAPATINRHIEDIVWAGETTQDIDVSAEITDARNAIWALTDAGNSYENILCSIKCTGATTVRITFDAAQTGTYRLIGLE